MKQKLEFGNYDFEKVGYQPVPKPSLNGGLYMGETFYKDAPWANIHIDPDSTVYINENLKRGNEPPYLAVWQYPPTRKGNSYSEWKGLKKYEGTRTNYGPYNIYCPPSCPPRPDNCICDELCPNAQTELCNKNNCVDKKITNGFSKYYYIV